LILVWHIVWMVQNCSSQTSVAKIAYIPCTIFQVFSYMVNMAPYDLAICVPHINYYSQLFLV
jgi:hypothetical protein